MRPFALRHDAAPPRPYISSVQEGFVLHIVKKLPAGVQAILFVLSAIGVAVGLALLG